ncbi:MAG: hypothetical protein ACK6DA_15155 [Candidatus Kapaibacterium sp.]
MLMSTMFFANSVAAQCPADSLPGPVSPMSPWLYICDTVMVPNNNTPNPIDSFSVKMMNIIIQLFFTNERGSS